MNKIVVTCFYLVDPKPGRSHVLYKEWFLNLLNSLTCNIIVFTDESSKKYLDSSNDKIIFIDLPFEELYYFKNYGLDFWIEQEKIDPNKNRSWKLGLLYNEKCKFIEKAIKLYPKINWFVWCDIGCFRDKLDLNFPIISHLNDDKMTLLQIKKFKSKELKPGYIFHPEQQERLGGGVQIATKKTWEKWISLYDTVFNTYIKNSSVNCDQGLLSTLALENKELVNLIPSRKTKITKSRWFYLLEYCSNKYKKRKSIWWF
ncbi:WlaTC/HtrL family glycosyltransferase [Polaribacter atrinae]|uniref:DUF5672 domain-containing protein n=1 Tax=Polaribacter atrinae TaxID=1333662 RepID=A0A176TA24_9FLAO|nr:WlaTC/HtrL family glycosyltransferase [Polaribacter atrinae]OAD44744.1 hypothetical protein LPB303_11345 [Polaribacter atrinae]